MDNKRQHHHERGSNGFLLGVVVGAVLALLFTTKKGRRILKALTEEGYEKISELEALIEQKKERVHTEVKDYLQEEAYEDVPGEDYAPPPESSVKHIATKPSPVRKVHTASRRYFRGVPKR